MIQRSVHDILKQIVHYIKTASQLHFPHLILHKVVSHFMYQKFNRFFIRIYKRKNEENNRKLQEQLKKLNRIPISKLIKDLKINQDFSIVCIKPNDNLHANLLEYYEIKNKYSNIQSCGSDFERKECFNDLGNYRLCLESLQSLSSCNSVYQIMVGALLTVSIPWSSSSA